MANFNYTKFAAILVVVTLIVRYYYSKLNITIQQQTSFEKIDTCQFHEKEISRDFLRYKCKKRIRIGGPQNLHDLWRIDGWLD